MNSDHSAPTGESAPPLADKRSNEESPAYPTPAKEQKKNPYALLMSWAGSSVWLYALSALLAVVGVAGQIVPFYAAGKMIVGVLDGNQDFAYYQQWCLVAALACAAYIVFHHASTAVSHKATFKTIARIRRLVAAKLTRTPLGYVLDTPTGTLKNVLVERPDSIEVALAHAVPEVTGNLLVPIAVIVYLFTLNWGLALASLVVIPIGVLVYSKMMSDYDVWFGRTVRTSNEMASASIEYVNGIEVIKAFGRSASSYEKFARAVHAYSRSYIDWMAHCQIWADLGLSILPATLVTVLPVGCGMMMAGWLEPSTFVLMAILSLSIFPPLYAVSSFVDPLAQVSSVVAEIDRVLSQPEQRRAKTPAQFTDAQGTPLAAHAAPRIELDGVRFSYGRTDADGDAVEVIHGIDLTIEPGTVTALVGPSGSGKSTLARLIAGFWDATEGEVRIGGASLATCTADQLADTIAYVAQDNYLFDDTVRENIRMGRPGATDDDVVAVAKASGCHDFIMSLEKGYDTVVGGAGGHLSGGERQRVAIARAMLKDAPVVILDEATAYTDPESEAVIERAVSRLVAGKTLIVIAHRLSTITDADAIVVVNGGAIEAVGTHEQLMAACALYRTMYLEHIDAKDDTKDEESPAC